MQRLVITGGAGFVGSNLAIYLQELGIGLQITCADSLRRRGSELALPRLKQHGVNFCHLDVRCPEDFERLPAYDLLIDCAAEPSVHAGIGESPLQVLNPNLIGTIHCLEAARQQHAAFLFLSSSRVYPIAAINQLEFVETESRFELASQQRLPGSSATGINEDFPLTGARSLYGATKLAAELLIQEYVYSHGMRAVINRCGILTGPWQMGKVDQGVVTYWMSRHLFQQDLRYLGYGGTGKQVRDMLHVADLAGLIVKQMQSQTGWDGQIFNVGGGLDCSLSLKQLTEHCRRRTGQTVRIAAVPETAATDIRIYLSDCSRVQAVYDWRPTHTVDSILDDIYKWLVQHRTQLEQVL